mmetsp:Transcript_44813/g.83075  ORF Transcript_44813/g.83075 Transcript_44813/m.83075 type:complete len:101 (-) Transcript_44813:11-313(-)
MPRNKVASSPFHPSKIDKKSHKLEYDEVLALVALELVAHTALLGAQCLRSSCLDGPHCPRRIAGRRRLLSWSGGPAALLLFLRPPSSHLGIRERVRGVGA